MPAVVVASFFAAQAAEPSTRRPIVAGEDQENVVLDTFGFKKRVELPDVVVDILNQTAPEISVEYGENSA